jgi:hypothetical protein
VYIDTVYEINIPVQVPKTLQILLPPRSNTGIAAAPATVSCMDVKGIDFTLL